MMSYWSMYKTAHLDPEHELVQRFPNAVSHDGSNTVFVAAPSDLTDAFIVPEGLEPEELLGVVGGFLVSQTTQPLVATKAQLEQLFRTPQHRLWCARYDNEADPAFLADKAQLSLPASMTITEAKAAIKMMVSQ
jgi:hypothetical protein